jgi:transposase
LTRAQRRLEILQQRIDRQRRRNNPDCYRPDNTWIKGRRARSVSRRMQRTLANMRRVHQKIADVRKGYWGRVSAEVVADYDQIFLGDWKPPGPKSKGERRAARKAKYKETGQQRKHGAAAAERGRNKSDADNSLADFRAQLAERIKRSMASKSLTIVREPGTTYTCPACLAPTGPTGQAGLAVRRWTCTACGAEHDRDIASAINIARRGVEASALEASGGTSVPLNARIPKVRPAAAPPANQARKSRMGAASAQIAQKRRGPRGPSTATEAQASVQRSPLAQPPVSPINSS